MHVAVLQLDTVWENKSANYQKVNRLIASLTDPVDLICLPEMFATGFTMQASTIAECADGPTSQFVRQLAIDQRTAVLGTVVEQGLQGGRNTALLFDATGSLVSRYAKIHPFSFAGEDQHYEKGLELPVAGWRHFQVATPICYDLRFPELFRHATYRGATLFIVPANWPAKRVQHWRSLLVARAIENLAYVIGINRAGEGNGLEYSGSSMIVAPTGDILSEAGPGERIIVADIDPDVVSSHREHFRFLNDVRSDLFPDLFAQRSDESRQPTAVTRQGDVGVTLGSGTALCLRDGLGALGVGAQRVGRFRGSIRRPAR